GEVMRVLDAGDSQRRRTDHGVSAIQPDALITITAYGSRTPGAVTEVLRQTIRIRPYLADLAAHGKHIAASHGPPLLDAQAAAVERLALVQSDAGANAKVDQIAFTRIVFFVNIAAQPLPGRHRRRHFVVIGTAD